MVIQTNWEGPAKVLMAVICLAVAGYLFIAGHNPQWAAGVAGIGVVFFIYDVAVQQKRSVDLEDVKSTTHRNFEKLVIRAFEKQGWDVTFFQTVNPLLDAVVTKNKDRKVLKIVNIEAGEPFDMVDKLLRLLGEAEANGLIVVDRSEHPDYNMVTHNHIQYVIGPDLIAFFNDSFGKQYDIQKVINEPSPAERMRQVQQKYTR